MSFGFEVEEEEEEEREDEVKGRLDLTFGFLMDLGFQMGSTSGFMGLKIQLKPTFTNYG